MQSFFTALVIVSVFTFLAKVGVVKFETLKAENIAKENFEFFLYLYLFLTGALAASSFEKRSIFRRFIKGFVGVTRSVYLGFSGALVGWSFGLLVYVLVTGKFESIAIGVFLTCIMLVFSMAPAWYHEKIESEKDRMVGFLFTEPRFSKVLVRVGWCFMVASAFGFYDYFSA